MKKVTAIEKNDAILLQEAQQKNENSFALIVKKYKTEAYQIALGFMGNHDDAWDAIQDAFTRSWLHINTFKSDKPFFPWFYQILRRICLNKIKHNNLHPLAELDDNENYLQDDSRFDPSVIVEQNDRNVSIWKTVYCMPVKQREIIVLRYFQELSYEEISHLLFINKGTVMSRLYYARKSLKDRLNGLLEQE